MEFPQICTCGNSKFKLPNRLRKVQTIQYYPNMDYQSRIQVYKHTQQVAHTHYLDIATTTKYTETSLTKIVPKRGPIPVINIVNEDTLDAYIALLKEGFKPVLLNMANDTTPGGGVERGCGQQEENLFRRTNYFMTLHPGYYPLINADILYSKNVTFFKSNEETGYKLITPMRISIIACPSVKHPPLNQHGEFRNPEDISLEYRKIVMIFKSAIENKHDSLLLSAFGCGSYRCPSNQVAELFKKAINDYGAYFKKIVFAIKQMPDDHKDNYVIFRDVLNRV